MSDQNPSGFPKFMNVVTLKNEMERIQKQLDDVEKAQIIMLIGEHGSGKTWIAGKIIDDATSRGKLSGALWFYLNKKYDDKSLLLDIAYQLSLLSTRRLLEDEDEAENKEGEKVDKKREEEAKRKKEQEMSLFWASEVWEDEEENEKEQAEEEEVNGHKEEAGKNKQELDFPQNSSIMIVENKANNEMEKEEEEEQEEDEEKKRKREKDEEEEKNKQEEKKLKEEEQKKKKEEERVKKLKQKVSAVLTMKKYILVFDGYKYETITEDNGSTKEKVKDKLDTHFQGILSKLETYVRGTKITFPKILITTSSYISGDRTRNEITRGEGSGCILDKVGEDLSAKTDGDGITHGEGSGHSHIVGKTSEDLSTRDDRDGNTSNEGKGEGKAITQVEGDGDEGNVVEANKVHNVTTNVKGGVDSGKEGEQEKAFIESGKGNGESSVGNKVSGAKWGLVIKDQNEIQIIALTKEDCKSLLEERCPEELSSHPRFEQLIEAILNSSKGLPAAVHVIAETLRHIAKEGHRTWTLDRAIDKVISKSELRDGDGDLFRCGYDMLPDSDIANCCWYSRQLFSKRGAVHFNELISYWIMEGFLADDCINKTYMRGYFVLKELMKRKMFIMREDNLVTMVEKALKIPDDRDHDIGGTSSLGLVNILEKKEWGSLGRIAPSDGMLKTPCNHKAWQMVPTVLMDESCLCREVPEDLFKRMKGLQVLVLLKPILDVLPPSLYSLKNLQILVLRGCELLCDVNRISEVQSLAVLEISGAGSLQKVPDDLFDKLTNLRCLNLSKSGITHLPSPSENSQEISSELRWLILRGCPNLEELPSLSKFKELQVINLSGSTSFKKIRDNFFTTLTKLKMVDFSKTQIEAFPIVGGGLKELNRLFFRNCEKLKRLPRFPPNVNSLDLSGCTHFLEFRDESLASIPAFKTLDLSQTEIASLPSIPMPSSLSKLGLGGFSKHKKFSSETALTLLESLDLSKAHELEEIDSQSFQHLKCIQVLKLSETQIKSLPSLDTLGSLHQLVLSGCQHLTELKKMDALTELEVLDLSRCTALTCLKLQDFAQQSRLQQLILSGAYKLKEFNATALKHMTLLQKLDLSENPLLEELLGMSNLSDLRELSLKGCASLKNFRGDFERHADFMVDFVKLLKLEVLDLSGTDVESLALTPFCKFLKLEVLHLSGTKIKEFPYRISEMTCLKCLSLPDLEEIKWREIKRLPEELRFDQHGIFTMAGTEVCNMPTQGSATQLMVAVCSIKQHAEEELFNCYQQKLTSVFQELRYSLPNVAGHCPFEVHGFETFPAVCKSFLESANYLSFNNASSSSLCSLGIDAVKDMRGCWFDRCPKLETILRLEKDDAAVKNLEILWLSNLPHLVSLCSENMKFKCFEKLKYLYLDCCPMLEHVFSFHNIPEKLKVLEIRFCDNLKSLFKNYDNSFQFNLDKLLLFALPEFSLGAELPSSRVKKVFVKNCPKLLSGVENAEFVQSWKSRLDLEGTNASENV